MKVLVCTECSGIFFLSSRETRRCYCKKSGGFYNADGDTATVWGPSRLLGLSNRALVPAIHGTQLTHLKGTEVMWPYPEDNGKITRLEEEPSARATGG